MLQVMDEAALKVLKAAEETKQLLQQKEEVLSTIRAEFEQKSKEVCLRLRFVIAHASVLLTTHQTNRFLR